MYKDLGETTTTEEHMLTRAREKQKLIDAILDIFKRASFDCISNNDGVDCLMCVPNDKPLFQKTIELDVMSGNDTCTPMHKLDEKDLKVYKKWKGQIIYSDKNEKKFYTKISVFNDQFMEVDKDLL